MQQIYKTLSSGVLRQTLVNGDNLVRPVGDFIKIWRSFERKAAIDSNSFIFKIFKEREQCKGESVRAVYAVNSLIRCFGGPLVAICELPISVMVNMPKDVGTDAADKGLLINKTGNGISIRYTSSIITDHLSPTEKSYAKSNLINLEQYYFDSPGDLLPFAVNNTMTAQMFFSDCPKCIGSECRICHGTGKLAI
jgi:hypothetical protein